MSFSPARWRVLSGHLDHLLELTGEQRAGWLATLRTEDTALAADLATLLERHQRLQSRGFLEGASPLPPPQASLAGHAIGAYTLRSLIGEGGMGNVWLADRTDGRFEGVVAVKLLNASLLGREGEARFTREGRILARLRHPHIATLIDAGVASFGHPYLVIEHVDGQHIDDYCDAARLPIGARIRLFLDVLEAVAHAHANLVVHRDIKPANVLVTASGQVKLLDFGIAKLLEGEAGAPAATALTREGTAALTPEYAAPEQLTGGDVTTLTDVYALGVLLYLLLCGRHPAAAGARSPADLMKAIVDDEPPRLSAAVADDGGEDPNTLGLRATRRACAAKRLRGLLKGDLDNVVAKALKKQPAERYPSVAAMADDLRRHLDDQPVVARADSFGYRAAKFVRRNRTPVALATLAVMALAIGLVGTITQARNAGRERAVAEQQRDFALRELSRAEAINELNSFLLSDAPPGGRPFTVSELLGRAERILQRQQGADGNRTEILVALGRQYHVQDEDTSARRLLTAAYETTRHGKERAARARAACALASALSKTGEFERAESLLKEGLGELPGEPQFVPHRVFCLLCGSEVARRAYEEDTAIDRAQMAQRLLRESGQGSAVLDLHVAIDLADSYRVAGRLPLAHTAFQDAWARLGAMGRGETKTAATLLNNWGQVVHGLGQPLAAERLFRRAVDISSANGTEAGAAPLLYSNLAFVKINLERLSEARDYAERAYTEARTAGNEVVTTVSLYRRNLAYIRLRDLPRAATTLAEIKTRVGRYPPGHYFHSLLASQEGLLAEARGDEEAARAAHDRAVALGKEEDLLSMWLLRRSAFALATGRTGEARSDAERALALARSHVDPGALSCHIGRGHLALARVLLALGDLSRARAAFAAALQHLEPTLGADHPETREARRRARDTGPQSD